MSQQNKLLQAKINELENKINLLESKLIKGKLNIEYGTIWYFDPSTNNILVALSRQIVGVPAGTTYILGAKVTSPLEGVYVKLVTPKDIIRQIGVNNIKGQHVKVTYHGSIYNSQPIAEIINDKYAKIHPDEYSKPLECKDMFMSISAAY